MRGRRRAGRVPQGVDRRPGRLDVRFGDAGLDGVAPGQRGVDGARHDRVHANLVGPIVQRHPARETKIPAFEAA